MRVSTKYPNHKNQKILLAVTTRFEEIIMWEDLERLVISAIGTEEFNKGKYPLRARLLYFLLSAEIKKVKNGFNVSYSEPVEELGQVLQSLRLDVKRNRITGFEFLENGKVRITFKRSKK